MHPRTLIALETQGKGADIIDDWEWSIERISET